jgi:hypothetical protein
MYAKQIRDALAGAIDTTKLAEAWQALHPKDVTKASLEVRPGSMAALAAGGTPPAVADPANKRPVRVRVPAATSMGTEAERGVSPTGMVSKTITPVLSAFLAAARAALTRALTAVLRRLYAEGWVLGQQAARKLATGLADVDWGNWAPGDYEAAEAIAGPGLRQLLANAGIVIKSIAESRVEELAEVLEATLRSDEVHRPPLPEPLPPMLSVGDLARQLREVLDDESRAWLVAQAEIGRAQAEAARTVYAETGVAEVEISTAEDAKVCPVCEAAEKVGPHPVGSPPMVLLHPRCRCAELPVLAGAS